ncbi:MAG: DUF504 domain-containing protein [Gallionellaceae bacterium]|nr:DUF504 domain-containing protein [Gallionellaceae bacterium]
MHELPAHVRWDAEFAKSRFVIGYLDHVAHQVVHVNLREIAWDPENPSFFDLVDNEGSPRSIPFHRVREVWRDGKLVWARHPTSENRNDQLPRTASLLVTSLCRV